MIPPEVIGFFKKEGGHSLIVKGEPGSGKTTFALEILSVLKNDFEVKYVSTRIADDVLFLQFPWLKELFERKIEKKEEKKISREELNRLEGLIEEGFLEEKVKFEEGGAVLEVGAMLPEMEDIYDFVESVHPKVALICIDSIDGLSEKYGIPAEKILYTLQKDLVEKGNANMIFILENAGFENIEYLGDGVISLHHEPWDGYWKRYMYIQKLRGAPIKNSKYIYTLHEGHFNALKYEPFSLDSLSEINLRDLEEYVKKVMKYRVVNFIIDPEFPPELIGVFFLSIIKNSQGTPLILPSSGYPGDLIKRNVEKFIGRDIKLAGFRNQGGDIVLEGRDMLIELSRDIISYHIGKDSLVILGIDTLGDLYGDLRDLPRLIENAKREHRVILFTPKDYPKLQGNIGVERKVFLESMENIPVIRDVGELNAIVEKEGGIKLIPLM